MTITSEPTLLPPGRPPSRGLAAAARNHWPFVVVPTLLALTLAGLIGLAYKPTFRAQTQMNVGRLNVNAPSIPGYTFAIQNLATSYSRLITADGVVRPVATRFHLRIGQVKARLSAAPIPQAPLIVITAAGTSAQGAVSLANAASASLSNYVASLNLGSAEARTLQAQYQPAAQHLNDLQTELRAVEAKPLTPANQRQRIALQDQVQEQSLQVDALRNAYLQSQTARGSASILQVLNSAQTASSNKQTHVEALLLVGLVAGLLAGLGLAKVRQDGLMGMSLLGMGRGARGVNADLEDLWEREPARFDRPFDTLAPPPSPPPGTNGASISADRGAMTPADLGAGMPADQRTANGGIPAGLGGASTGLDSGRANAAVRAYCREMYGPVGSRRAVAEILAAVTTGVGSSDVAEHELLRMTRVAAVKQASHIDQSSARLQGQCAETPTRLVALANGELDGVAQRELNEHLQECLVCQAVQIKMDRAERAFLVMAAAPVGIESAPASSGSAAAIPAASSTYAPVSAPGVPVPGPDTPAEPGPASTAPAAAPGFQRFERATPVVAGEGIRKWRVAAASGALVVGGVVAVALALHGGSTPATGGAAIQAKAPQHAASSRARHTATAHRAPVKHRTVAVHKTTAPKRVITHVSAPTSSRATTPPATTPPPATPIVSHPAARTVSHPVTPAPHRSTPSAPSVAPTGGGLPAVGGAVKPVG